jgi:signal transduction histidine kinase
MKPGTLETHGPMEGATVKVLQQLSEVLLEEREAILAEWRERVTRIPAAVKLDTPALNDHMPRFLRELAEALRRSESGAACDVQSCSAHGEQRCEDGFDISQVVAEYHMLRVCIHAAVAARGIVIQGESLHTLDRVLDEAIAAAVKTFAERQAAEAQRRREEYLAFVAHDLRTPINAITLAAHLLELRWPGGGPDADTERIRRTLVRNARHLETLVNQVLQENLHVLTELGIRLERRHFELWPLVEGVMLDLQALAVERRTRLVNAVPDALRAFADAAVLRRIFQNLLGNAIRYTPDGSVTVGARTDPATREVECWVSDTGSGIPPDRMDRVFDALETDGEGLGLGLAIVKTFVEAHGGRVALESVPGAGCTFRFTLPSPG